jgi:homogentisate 1,2-dioxygenase
VDPDVISLGQYRWDPVPHTDRPLTWLTGMRTMTTAGDVNTQVGMASHIYLVTASMKDSLFLLRRQRASGRAARGPAALLHRTGHHRPRAQGDRHPAARAGLPGRGAGGPCRGFVCENYGQKFELPAAARSAPTAWPTRATSRRPVAAFEDREVPSTVTVKWCGQFHETEIGHSPLDVVAWHGNYAPCKYDLRTYCPVGAILFDHPDPSIFTVLTAPSGVPGTANIDFVLFRERWMVAEDTFRPPWYHKNIMSELMGNIYGQYDAKPQGFVPGGMSLHNMMLPHGPDKDAFEKASNADLGRTSSTTPCPSCSRPAFRST